MPRVLLVLSTDSYRVTDFLRSADALGVEVSVAAEEPLPMVAPDRFVLIDCHSPEQAAQRLVELASTTPVDAILAVDDRGTVPAAIASQRLGLAHHTVAGIRATNDKLVLRQTLSQAEISQPRWRTLSSHEDPAAVAGEIGFPVVIKPKGLSASRGVIRADDEEAAVAVARRVRAIQESAGGDVDDPLLVEEYLDGFELAVEALAWEGQVEVLAIFDKPDPLTGPFFEETIYVTPSRSPIELQEEVGRMVVAAALHLGLTAGPIHAEVRVVGTRPYLIEIAGRTIGGSCSRSLGFGLADTSLETLVLRHALGMPKHLPRRPGSDGVMMLPIPGPGILHGVKGVAECRAVPGITDLEISIPLGEPVVLLPEGSRYLGFLFAHAATPQQVETALREGHRRLRFDIR